MTVARHSAVGGTIAATMTTIVIATTTAMEMNVAAHRITVQAPADQAPVVGDISDTTARRTAVGITAVTLVGAAATAMIRTVTARIAAAAKIATNIAARRTSDTTVPVGMGSVIPVSVIMGRRRLPNTGSAATVRRTDAIISDTTDLHITSLAVTRSDITSRDVTTVAAIAIADTGVTMVVPIAIDTTVRDGTARRIMVTLVSDITARADTHSVITVRRITASAIAARRTSVTTVVPATTVGLRRGATMIAAMDPITPVARSARKRNAIVVRSTARRTANPVTKMEKRRTATRTTGTGIR